MQTWYFSSRRDVRPFVKSALSLAILGALIAPQFAYASAFQLKEDSAKAMGRAYAGQATAGGDASVVANNPAAMTELKGTYVQGDMTAINFSAKFKGNAYYNESVVSNTPIDGDNGDNAGTTMPVPALFFVKQINSRWHMGAAFTAPFGFQTQYDRHWKGRYHGIKSQFESLDATLSAAYALTDNFSLGASLIAQKTSAELTQAINFNDVYTEATGKPPINPLPDGFARIKASSWAYGWQLGGFWKLSPDDRLALNYRAKINHKLTGTANFQVPDEVRGALNFGGYGDLFTDTGGSAKFATPAVVSASYWHQAEKYGLGIDLAWTQWDSFKQLNIVYNNPKQPVTPQVFNWHNSWYASVGGDYYLSNRLTLRSGIGLDLSPTHIETRDVRVPDADRTLAAVGLGYKASPNLEINASYVHIFVKKARLRDALSTTGDTISGSYKDYGNLLALSVQYKF